MDSIEDVIKKTSPKFNRPSIKNGFTQIKNKIIVTDKLTFNEKLILICLLMHKMNKKVAFPSYSTIARELGCSRSTAIRSIDSLLKKRYIIREKRAYRSNRYSFNIK